VRSHRAGFIPADRRRVTQDRLHEILTGEELAATAEYISQHASIPRHVVADLLAEDQLDVVFS
jgi:hypothetical protein